MADQSQTFSIRLKVVDGNIVSGELNNIAETGKAAFDKLGAAAQHSSGLLRELAGPVLGYLSGEALIGLAENALHSAAALGEMAEQVGVSVESFQALRFAATQVGVGQETLDKGLTVLTRNIGQALEGNKNLAGSFEKLGVQLLDANGKTRGTTAVFLDIVEAINRIPDPARRAAAEAEIFGDKIGPKLANLINVGAGGLNEFENQAKSLGLILSTDTVEQLRKTEDAFKAIGTGITVLAGKALESLGLDAENITRIFQDMVNAINAATKSFHDFFATFPNSDAHSDTLSVEGEKLYNLQKLIDDTKAHIDKLKDNPIVLDRDGKIQRAEADLQSYNASLAAIQARMGQISNNFWNSQNAPAVPTGLATDKTGAGIAATNKGLAAANDNGNDALRARNALQQEANRIIDQTLTKQEKYALQVDKINNLEAQGFLTADQANRARDKAYEDMTSNAKEAAEAARQLGLTFQSAFEDAITGGKSFSSVLSSLLKDIGKLLIRKNITEPLFGGISKSLEGSGFLGGLFGGFFADGGSPPLNRVSIVGERGPELFVPRVPGTIIPNGGFGGNVTNQVNTHVTISTGGAQIDQDQARKLGNEISRQTEARVNEVMRQQLRPGGMFHRAA